jgi:hypothetical protein
LDALVLVLAGCDSAEQGALRRAEAAAHALDALCARVAAGQDAGELARGEGTRAGEGSAGCAEPRGASAAEGAAAPAMREWQRRRRAERRRGRGPWEAVWERLRGWAAGGPDRGVLREAPPVVRARVGGSVAIYDWSCAQQRKAACEHLLATRAGERVDTPAGAEWVTRRTRELQRRGRSDDAMRRDAATHSELKDQLRHPLNDQHLPWCCCCRARRRPPSTRNALASGAACTAPVQRPCPLPHLPSEQRQATLTPNCGRSGLPASLTTHPAAV